MGSGPLSFCHGPHEVSALNLSYSLSDGVALASPSGVCVLKSANLQRPRRGSDGPVGSHDGVIHAGARGGGLRHGAARVNHNDDVLWPTRGRRVPVGRDRKAHSTQARTRRTRHSETAASARQTDSPFFLAPARSAGWVLLLLLVQWGTEQGDSSAHSAWRVKHVPCTREGGRRRWRPWGGGGKGGAPAAIAWVRATAALRLRAALVERRPAAA